MRKKLLDKRDHIGTVVANEDPEFKGRCKIRVFGVYDDIDDEDLPWSHQYKDLSFGDGGASGRISIPKLGAVVHVTFNQGNYYFPEYRGIQELAPDLIEELRASYLGSHSLIYDKTEEVRLFYTQKKGLMLDLKESKINIAADNSIRISHKDESSSIELKGGKISQLAESDIEAVATNQIKHTSEEIWLDGKTVNIGHVPAFSAVCSEPLWAFLKILAASVDSKNPATPGVMTALAEQFEQLSTSDVVKITKSNSGI